MKIQKLMSRLGWALFAFLAVSSAVQFAVMQAVRADLSANWILILNYLSMYLVGYPVCIRIMRTIPAWKKNGFQQLKLWEFALWTVFCLGLITAGNYATQIVMLLLGMSAGQDAVELVLQQVSPWLSFLVTVLIAPVMEEFLFRKMLLERIVFIGQKRAMLISGLLFGLFHGNLEQFFYAFLLGTAFAYLYLRTGRLKYCILIHMIVNFFGGIVPMMILHIPFRILQMMALSVLVLFQIACVAAAAAVGILYIKEQPLFGQLAPVPGTKDGRFRWSAALLSPGMLALFAGEILFFGLSLMR